MSNFAICYVKKSKKIKFCRIEQNNIEFIVQFNTVNATVFYGCNFLYPKSRKRRNQMSDTNEVVKQISLKDILPFPDHPFEIRDDDAMKDTVQSVKDYGVIIFVNKELQRVNKETMEKLDKKDVILVFPHILSGNNTSLVLKSPKTKTSVRKIFLPKSVASMLTERKKQIEEMKELYGDEYTDYDLVFCHSSGRPMESQVISRALKKLITDNDLPPIVFHSFRHASITYKLKWNGGDMKSVQGDSGHARMDMVADVYSHIIDEDRRFNAQKFEEQFYNTKGLRNTEEGKTAPMPRFSNNIELLDTMAVVEDEETEITEEPKEDDNVALLTKILANPDAAALLKALAKSL